MPIAGSGGAVAIYTDKMKPIRIVRKVVLPHVYMVKFLV